MPGGSDLYRFGSFCMPGKLVSKLVLMIVLVIVALLIERHLLPFARRPERPLLQQFSNLDILRSAFIGSASLICWLSLAAIPLVATLHNWPVRDLLGSILVVWLALATCLTLALIIYRQILRRAAGGRKPGKQNTTAATSATAPWRAATGVRIGGNPAWQLDVPSNRVVPFRPRQGAQRPRGAPPPSPQPAAMAADAKEERGATSMSAAFAACRPAFVAISAISLVMNILMLSGPLYMLQVYDRVLTSRSIETLVLLTVLLIGLYAVFGVLDTLRARVLSRISIRFDRQLSVPLLKRVVQPGSPNSTAGAARLMGDLEQIRQFIAGPTPSAMFDLPWTPIYFVILFLLHPLLGLAAVVGAGVLVVVSLANQLLTQKPLARAAEENNARTQFSRPDGVAARC